LHSPRTKTLKISKRYIVGKRRTKIELVFLAGINAIAWAKWCHNTLGVSPLRARPNAPVLLLGNPFLCFGLILVVLMTASSRNVRGSAFYALLYELTAGLWLAGGMALFPFFGVSLRDDVLERANPGALWAVSGALLGLTACFAGANVGNGPGPQAVLFTAIVASAAFFLVWYFMDLAVGRWSEAITIDRNLGAGARLGVLLLCAGLAFGSAMTGDWVSAGATMRDFFIRSWPVAPALCLAALAERRLRRSSKPYSSWIAAVAHATVTIVCIAVERRMR
jgi:hypothetical protein